MDSSWFSAETRRTRAKSAAMALLGMARPVLTPWRMDSGMYAACAALISRTQELDTVANNLANASTVGYRAQQNVFGSVLAAAADSAPTALNQAINQYGILTGTSLDESQGAMQKTGNDLDLAIQGPGYFVVQTANGPMYTRSGAFQVSAKGELITATGDQILGDKGPIKVLPGKVSVSADGTISSNGAVSGKIRMVEFPQGTKLTSMGNVYYSAPANTERPATKSDLRQGMLESSNVNPITMMVQLVNAQRSAEMMQRALSMFNTEIDKTAAQELPKVE